MVSNFYFSIILPIAYKCILNKSFNQRVTYHFAFYLLRHASVNRPAKHRAMRPVTNQSQQPIKVRTAAAVQPVVRLRHQNQTILIMRPIQKPHRLDLWS